ncbi:MAG: hemolysin family protein [Oligoflexia bacterium]|nr:hemolysin family protein [Oligoflexia bacterium]
MTPASESAILLFLASICTVLTACFTAMEVALISSDRVLLNKKKTEGNRGAALALKHLDNIDLLLSTTQLGSNLFIALATTLATIFFSKQYPGNQFLFMLIFAPLTLIFSDSLPKVLGRIYSEKIALFFSLPLLIFSRFFMPALLLISFYTSRLSSLVGLGTQDSLVRRKKAREELQALLSEQDSQSDIRLGHKRMIRRILGLSQQSVKKIMIPLVNVDAIEKNSSIEDAIDVFESLRHSRLPVYDERIDNIVGVLYFSDVFQCSEPETEKVSSFMKKPLFVPEFQQLNTLTKEMQHDLDIAVAVDEYGGAVGILTKEDILEEIVGDISDEWDEPDLGITEISEDSFLIQVNTEIDEINEKLNIQVPKGDYETFAGFLLQQFNRIPSEGDELYYANFKVKVHRATDRAIETVIVNIHRVTEK